jgi:hypothetical protein
MTAYRGGVCGGIFTPGVRETRCASVEVSCAGDDDGLPHGAGGDGGGGAHPRSDAAFAHRHLAFEVLERKALAGGEAAAHTGRSWAASIAHVRSLRPCCLHVGWSG